jgi:aspartate/methionine/tyrosine aminotransferase
MSIREFQLERYFAEWEFEAPYLLSASDCETMSIGELLDLVEIPLAELAALRLGYTESQGDPALREVVARFHSDISGDNVVITNAPEEAIFLMMTSLLSTDDQVVVQTPCYQSLFELATYRGCDVRPWPMVETENGWRMDLDHLEQLVTEDTCLLVINVPHNPTGYIPSREEFDAIIAIASRFGTWLFCDEMYRGLEHGPDAQLPSASDCYPAAVSLWGMSKTFGLAGLRIGWLATQDNHLIKSILRHKDYTTICSSAPGEFLARAALQKAGRIVERNKEIILTNLNHVHQFMSDWPDVFAWREPLAGPVAFARLVEANSEEFCLDVVQKSGVLLVPSTLFEYGNRHVRWGLGRRNFPEGLAVLDDYLHKSSAG